MQAQPSVCATLCTLRLAKTPMIQTRPGSPLPHKACGFTLRSVCEVAGRAACLLLAAPAQRRGRTREPAVPVCARGRLPGGRPALGAPRPAGLRRRLQAERTARGVCPAPALRCTRGTMWVKWRDANHAQCQKCWHRNDQPVQKAVQPSAALTPFLLFLLGSQSGFVDQRPGRCFGG